MMLRTGSTFPPSIPTTPSSLYNELLGFRSSEDAEGRPRPCSCPVLQCPYLVGCVEF